MVLLVLSKQGFHRIETLLENHNVKCWVNEHILTKDEIEAYKRKGIDITDFAYGIDFDSEEQVNNAVQLLHEHHPDKIVFVER
jgi:hypothetical protein